MKILAINLSTDSDRLGRTPCRRVRPHCRTPRDSLFMNHHYSIEHSRLYSARCFKRPDIAMRIRIISRIGRDKCKRRRLGAFRVAERDAPCTLQIGNAFRQPVDDEGVIYGSAGIIGPANGIRDFCSGTTQSLGSMPSSLENAKHANSSIMSISMSCPTDPTLQYSLPPVASVISLACWRCGEP